MNRTSPGGHQDDIEADIVTGEPRPTLQKRLGRPSDSLALMRAEGIGRVVGSTASFDLDDKKKPSPFRDDVDLADRASEAPRQDAKPFAAEIDGGDGFGETSESLGTAFGVEAGSGLRAHSESVGLAVSVGLPRARARA